MACSLQTKEILLTAPSIRHEAAVDQMKIDMSASLISPRLVRAGIVTMDPDTPAVLGILALQCSPDSLTATLHIQAGAAGTVGRRLRP
jgi:hypothetical protein